MKTSSLLLLAFFLCLGSSPLVCGAVSTIGHIEARFLESYANSRDSASLSPFSDPSVLAIGQTFSPFDERTLGMNSVSLWIRPSPGQSGDFSVHTALWDSAEAKISGPVTEWAGADHLETNANVPGYVNFRFDDPIGLPVSFGLKYILFVTSAEFPTTSGNGPAFGFVPDENNQFLYLGGESWLLHGTNLGGEWTQQPGDLGFTAAFIGEQFSPVPEVSTYGVFGSALLLAVAAWRRGGARVRAG